MPAHWFRLLCCTLSLVLAGLGTIHADELRPLGLARIDITPSYPVRMTGYSNRKQEFEGVEQRIWAKALAIDADGQGAAVLITLDSLGVPQTMTDEVAARLKSKHGIEPERVVICASHTHCAPGLPDVARLIFEEVTAEQRSHMQRYERELTDKLEQVALAALADRKPGRLSWSQGSADFAVNRRRLADGKIQFGITPAPAGRVDHALPMLRVTDPDGKLRGVLANYACHCTTLGGLFNRVCGDWAGYAQEIIEREHPGAVAMISIGCGADANPQPRDELIYAQVHGQTIAREFDRLLNGPWKPVTGTLVARRAQIELPFDTLPTRAEYEDRARQKGPIAWHAKAQLARLDRGEKLPTELPYTIGAWAFDDELAMVFLAGEVVVDYDLRLKRECDGRRLWVTAYANDDPCYIASKRVLSEGGYEVDGSMYYYDRPTHFSPVIEDKIISTVEDMLPAGFKRAAR